MIKKYKLIGSCVFFLSLAFTGVNINLYAADSELTLETDDNTSGFAVKNDSGTTVMRAGGDGNVSIGTDTPIVGAVLDVVGNDTLGGIMIRPYTSAADNNTNFLFTHSGGEPVLRLWRNESPGAGIRYNDNVNRLGFEINNNEYLSIQENGRVGIGKINPLAALDILPSVSDRGLVINIPDSPLGRPLEIINSANDQIAHINADGDIRSGGGVGAFSFVSDLSTGMYNPALGEIGFTNSGTEHVRIDGSGNVGIGTLTPNGTLDVNGTIFQRGGVLHADYVFESDYKLESIEEHADFMWENRHLKAIPEAKVDENGQEIIEVGAHRKGILEELEKAHIYIEQLHKQNKELEDFIKEVKVENSQLKEKLLSMEARQRAIEAVVFSGTNSENEELVMLKRTSQQNVK